MAELKILSYGKYGNPDAVEKVLRYITRSRPGEDRGTYLKSYGGMGVTIYSGINQIIQEFLHVQEMFLINSRGGRRMYHEILCLEDDEAEGLDLYGYALDCCQVYFAGGHQVVFAVHWDREKHWHPLTFYDIAKDTKRVSLLVFVLHNILDIAVQNFTKDINGMCADAFIPF